jgi:penicillin-binding protein 1A
VRTRARVEEPGAAGPPAAVPPKIKKLRLALILLGLSTLALVSTVFGMMMAVSRELPALENTAEYRAARNSILLADNGPQIAKLTGNRNRILLREADISPMIRNAVIAIEDRRFYSHEGVDYTGIARALWQDIRRQKAVQGGSTITQQFVKNALAAQGDRSVFQKLRESALAYHLERRWPKQKILTQYLNTVYFGNGAYGIESAARTYFGDPGRRYTPEDRLAENVSADQAALLAGLIASPTAYDPIQNPTASRERRDDVLDRMLEQGMITTPEHDEAVRQAIPSEEDVDRPRPDSTQPYFSTWVTQQLVDRYGSGRVFGGGMKIETTLDTQMQAAAEQAVQRLEGIGPTASLVAIENRTGEVKAMVGGTNFRRTAFNLATNGHRQPGSAFKPFILAEALRQGIGPGTTFASRRKVIPYRKPNGKKDVFVVRNYEGSYSGVTSLAAATTKSDNSVYAELGMRLGTKKVARMAERMGIKTDISTNPAMTLGGLKEGVTPLEMAYAYSTIANKGKRVSGTLASYKGGPVAIQRVNDGDHIERNKARSRRVFSEAIGEQMRGLLRGVVVGGTGTKAQVATWSGGKTGTTENYGDAWFVGFTDRYTVAVWVGYPDRLRYMTTHYRGQPVAGGTYPAEIWRDFVSAVLRIDAGRGKKPTDDGESAPGLPQGPAPSTGGGGGGGYGPSESPPSASPGGGGGGGGGREPPQRTPQPQPQPAPQPQPSPPPGGGGGAPPSGGAGGAG